MQLVGKIFYLKTVKILSNSTVTKLKFKTSQPKKKKKTSSRISPKEMKRKFWIP